MTPPKLRAAVTRARGTAQALVDRWNAAHETLFTLLDGVGADSEAHTVAVSLIPKRISGPKDFVDWLEPQVLEDGTWGFVTGRSANGSHGFALPVSPGAPPELISSIGFVEVHTWMVSWWLMYAWRARQLATAAAHHLELDDVVAAASCARGLVETAAALWSDAATISEAWRVAKAGGSVDTDRKAIERCSQLMTILSKVMFGAKFTRSQELKATFGRFERTNVLGQIDKLAKRRAATLTEDYEWLCNTVHPSIGNAFVFGSLWLRHTTGTIAEVWFAPKSLRLDDPNGDAQQMERPVQSALARASAVALAVLSETFDDTLSVVDDVALTTRAPELARRPYWRNIRRPGLYQPCPCRSGKKVKWCRHVWGESTGKPVPRSGRE
jgi:hypothetical protein